MTQRSNSVKILTPMPYDNVFSEPLVRNDVTLSGTIQAVDNTALYVDLGAKVLGAVRGQNTILDSLISRENFPLENSVLGVTAPNSWEGWFQTVHGCEMGDAFEPQAEDVLAMAGFELTPCELIPPGKVLEAAEVVRMHGERNSTLALMHRHNVNDWTWSVDPFTNRWICHAAFQR